MSLPFQLSATGNPTTTPPGTPAALTGLVSFTIVCPPEPPPFALVGVGMAIVFLCRRRRS